MRIHLVRMQHVVVWVQNYKHKIGNLNFEIVKTTKRTRTRRQCSVMWFVMCVGWYFIVCWHACCNMFCGCQTHLHTVQTLFSQMALPHNNCRAVIVPLWTYYNRASPRQTYSDLHMHRTSFNWPSPSSVPSIAWRAPCVYPKPCPNRWSCLKYPWLCRNQP